MTFGEVFPKRRPLCLGGISQSGKYLCDSTSGFDQGGNELFKAVEQIAYESLNAG
jgi:hypothetical protein